MAPQDLSLGYNEGEWKVLKKKLGRPKKVVGPSPNEVRLQAGNNELLQQINEMKRSRSILTERCAKAEARALAFEDVIIMMIKGKKDEPQF